MKAILIITIVVAFLAVVDLGIIKGSAPDDEERRLEDEEQMEWIRKWREEHERTERKRD